MKQGYDIQTVDVYQDDTRVIVCKNYHFTNLITNYHFSTEYYVDNYTDICDVFTVAVFKIKPKTVK